MGAAEGTAEETVEFTRVERFDSHSSDLRDCLAFSFHPILELLDELLDELLEELLEELLLSDLRELLLPALLLRYLSVPELLLVALLSSKLVQLSEDIDTSTQLLYEQHPSRF